MSREPNFQQPRLRFDWTVSLGNLLTVFGGLIAMCAAYVDYRLTADRHEARILANEVAVVALTKQQSEEGKIQQEMTRALDRLTFQLQASGK